MTSAQAPAVTLLDMIVGVLTGTGWTVVGSSYNGVAVNYPLPDVPGSGYSNLGTTIELRPSGCQVDVSNLTYGFEFIGHANTVDQAVALVDNRREIARANRDHPSACELSFGLTVAASR